MHGDECIYTAVVLVIAGTSIRLAGLCGRVARRIFICLFAYMDGQTGRMGT